MIEIARKRAGLTQKEVAQAIGIDHVSSYHRQVLHNLEGISLVQATILQRILPVKLSVTQDNRVNVELTPDD